ncbi:TRL domain-containing protein [Leptospira sp. 96542]|nr:TRL domain-containing protein [Leptospira sp. 96542]
MFLLGCFPIVQCISAQLGNPSLTVIQSRGQQGWYAKNSIPALNLEYKETCIRNYFGLVSVGSADYESIVGKGQWKEVLSVDLYTKTQYLFFQENCLRVTGR